MDNSIQQIINTLSNEITQLKYKNETTVTMRIDTIIEFLEQLKTDIIEEQQDQKFDLHRTATNCTITILDANEDPITDGSNKLSYGDIITISVTANAGYENPTLSVNGLPFVSGDTLVVKADLNIVGTATAVAPSLVAFEVDQVIKGFNFGNVSNGDTNSSLDTWLLSLPASMEGEPLVQASPDVALQAFHIQYEGIEAGVLISSTFDNEGLHDVAPIYSTSAFELEGLTFTRGYQNLTNGKIEYPYEDYYAEVATIRSDASSWNGVFVGAVETTIPSLILTPFSDGANPTIIGHNDKIGFDTSKVSEFTQLLSTNDYQSQPAMALFTLQNSDATYGELFMMLDISALGNGGTGYVLYKNIPSTNASIPIFATTSGEVGGMSFVQGFQNLKSGGVLDFDTELQIGSLNTETTSVTWNGVLIGKVVGN